MSASANGKLFTTPTEPKPGPKKPRKKRARGTLARWKVNTSFPGEAKPTIEAFRKKLKMSMSEFIRSLVAYGCWCEREHHLTGDAVREGGEAEMRMWKEIIADFGKPNKSGSFFEHRAAELAAEIARKTTEGSK